MDYDYFDETSNGQYRNIRLARFLQIYGICSAPINICGAIVIVRGSTEAMSGYKWHLLNFQMWSTIFELLMCNFITNLPQIHFETGLCYGLIVSHLGGTIFLCAILGSVCVACMFLSIIQCFAFRHQSLLSPASEFKLTKQNFLVLVFIIYIVVLVLVAFTLYKSYRLHIDEITAFRWYDLHDDKLSYYEMNPNIFKKVVFFPAVVFMVLGMALIVLFTASSAYILLSSGQNLSAKTKAMQWAFIRALCIQTGLPIAVIVVPFMYRLVQAYTTVRSEYGSREDEMGTLAYLVWEAMHCHGLLSTLSLFMLKPYREYVKAIFGLDKLAKSFFGRKPTMSSVSTSDGDNTRENTTKTTMTSTV